MNVLALLKVIELLSVFDVHHGDQHVPEVLESVFNLFLLKLGRNDVSLAKRKVHELLDVLRDMFDTMVDIEKEYQEESSSS